MKYFFSHLLLKKLQCFMELQTLQLPQTFPEAMDSYKALKRHVYTSWSNMHHKELKAATYNMYTVIRSLLSANDQKHYLRIIFGVRLLGKIRPPYFLDLINILSSLLPIQDRISSEMASIFIAKFCRYSYIKDTSIIQDFMGKCSDWLISSGPKYKYGAAIHMLKWFGYYSSSALLSLTQIYVDTIGLGIFHQVVWVRMESAEILSNFLNRSRRYSYITGLFKKSYDFYRKNKQNKVHGTILMFTLAAKFAPTLFKHEIEKIMEFSLNLIANRDRAIGLSALNLIISLGPLSPIVFRQKYSSYITQIIFDNKSSPEMIKFLIPIFEDFPDTLSIYASPIVSCLFKLFSDRTKSPDSFELAFTIMNRFAEMMPLEYAERFSDIVNIINSAPISKEYALYVAPLMKSSKKLWKVVQDDLATKLNENVASLLVVAKCPLFSDDNRKKLYNKFFPLIKSRSPDIRIAIPAALAQLDPHGDFGFVEMILRAAITEINPKIRLEVIMSFTKDHYHILSRPDCMNLLYIFSNDESAEVKQATITLFGQLCDLIPANVLPTFRRIILDTLFICSSDHSLTIIARASESLPLIIKAAKPLLAIYTKVFAPIAIDFLSGKTQVSLSRSNQQTSFEQYSSNAITVNYIDSLALITEIEPELLNDSYEDLINLFIKILDQSTNKKIILAILNAFDAIFNYLGLNIIPKIPHFINELYLIGSKFSTPKIHAALFKLLGRLGPIEPEEKTVDVKTEENENDINTINSISSTNILYQDWYLSIIANSLLSILEEDTPTASHYQAMQVLSISLTSSSPYIQPLFEKFMNHLLNAIRRSPSDEIEQYFQLFSSVISRHSEWLRVFAPKFADLFEDLSKTSFFHLAINLISPLAKSIREAFSPYLPRLIPLLLDKLFITHSSNPEMAKDILSTLTTLTVFAADFVYIILNRIVECILDPLTNHIVIITGLNSLQTIISKFDCESHSAQIYRVCQYCYRISDESVKIAASSLLTSLNSAFDLIRTSSSPHVTPSNSMEFCLKKYDSADMPTMVSNDESDSFDIPNSLISLNLNENILVDAAVCKSKLSSSQWEDWLRNFVLNVINQSPCQVIKNCIGIAQSSPAFAMKIFYASFLSCWTQMSEYSRTAICNSFECALNDSTTPMFVLATLVGLAEFMEKSEQHLSFSYYKLSKAAERSEKLPFALFCADKSLVKSSPNSIPIPTSPKRKKPEKIRRSSYEESQPKNVPILRLGSFPKSKALARANDSDSISLETSFDSLFDLEKLPADQYLLNLPSSPLSHAIMINDPKGFEAAENVLLIMSQLGMVSDMRGFIASTNINISAKLAEQLHDWPKAIELYSKANMSKDSLVGLLHSYTKVHRWQEISQLFIPYFDDLPATEKQETAVIFADAFYHLNDYKNFDKAIAFAPQNSVDKIILHSTANVLRGIDATELIEKGFKELAIRAGPLFAHGYSSLDPFIVSAQQLVELLEFQQNNTSKWDQRKNKLSFHLNHPIYELRIRLTHDELETKRFIKFARRNEEWHLHDLYCRIYPNDNDITYEKLQSKWKHGIKKEAYEELKKLTEKPWTSSWLKSHVLYTLSFWTYLLNPNEISSLIEAANLAEQSTRKKSAAFFALLHTKLYNMHEGDRAMHAIHAIHGFTVSGGLPGIQQLGSILFRSGKYEQVFDAVEDDLKSLDPALWLNILPQIISQLNHKNEKIRSFITNTIRLLLREHYHQVIFLIIFSSRYGSTIREATNILLEYELECPEIVGGARIFFDGFMTACSTRIERWMETLSTACEFLKQNDAQAMQNLLNPMFEDLNIAYCSDDETFNQAYSPMLLNLKPKFDTFYSTRTRKVMEGIWRECKDIYTKLKSEADGIKSITVSVVAPKLDEIKNLNIAVPGTYKVGKPIIKIKNISTSMEVFASKQRPKRFYINGEDGIKYFYLLKGKEDLRLDERAMQFFSLINALIKSSIVTYFVMPLSPSAGIIQWINNSDTLSKLIRDYRSSRGIPIDTEGRKVATYSIPHYDLLRPIQRLEVLKNAAEDTVDTVLADVLWIKSTSTENWLKRISNFSSTSALMSVVGYILGLGDRHTSNIMIQRETGNVIHIDLGDCFEITKNRLLFPELIPFRLTRFMVRALGPAGVNGLFKETAEQVMKIIRRRRENVMAVLEIFVHSPITMNKTSKLNTQQSEKKVSPNEVMSLEVSDNQAIEEEHALITISRISDKLNGNDFEGSVDLDHQQQVAMLIKSATDPYNFSHLYRGWNPLW